VVGSAAHWIDRLIYCILIRIDSGQVSREAQEQLSIKEIKLRFKTNAAQSIRSNGNVKTNVLGI
jgi:hypothetical protein